MGLRLPRHAPRTDRARRASSPGSPVEFRSASDRLDAESALDVRERAGDMGIVRRRGVAIAVEVAQKAQRFADREGPIRDLIRLARDLEFELGGAETVTADKDRH